MPSTEVILAGPACTADFACFGAAGAAGVAANTGDRMPALIINATSTFTFLYP
jgi:hypothetical protein